MQEYSTPSCSKQEVHHYTSLRGNLRKHEGAVPTHVNKAFTLIDGGDHLAPGSQRSLCWDECQGLDQVCCWKCFRCQHCSCCHMYCKISFYTRKTLVLNIYWEQQKTSTAKFLQSKVVISYHELSEAVISCQKLSKTVKNSQKLS